MQGAQAKTKTRFKLKALLYPFHNQILKTGWCFQAGVVACLHRPHRERPDEQEEDEQRDVEQYGQHVVVEYGLWRVCSTCLSARQSHGHTITVYEQTV